MFKVTVFYKDDGKISSHTVTRKNEAAVSSYVEEEARWEDTVRVVCPELQIDVSGDYVNFR
jgi:hypothetical protein